MKKTLIAAGVAAAMAIPAVGMADARIGGVFHTSIDFADNGDDSSHQLSCHACRMNFSGSEDFGGGLTGKFFTEIGFNQAGARGSLIQRNIWLGLNGGFGEVRVGRHDTAYKTATGRLDVFPDSVGDRNTIMGSLPGFGGINDRRDSNMIYYMSPNFDGFRVNANYVTDVRGDGDRPQADDPNDQNAFALAASYTQGPMYLVAAYEQLNDFGGGSDDHQAFKLGGSYKFNQFVLNLVYENIDNGDNDRDAIYVSGIYNMPNNVSLVAAYTWADEFAGDDDAQVFAVGARYNFSRHTYGYVMYAQLKMDEDVAVNGASYSLGTSGHTKSIAPAAGEDTAQAFSVGLRHIF